MSTNLSPRIRKVLINQFNFNNKKNNSSLDQRVDSSDKDLLISRLKAEIFEHEQNEKNYNNLNVKYRNLQNEHNLVCEEKLRLEYDLKQISESSAKEISDFKYDIENLQLNFNEKLSLNKKLFKDNNTFYKTLENKNAEIDDLLKQLNFLEEKINRTNLENNSLEKNVFNLQETKSAQKLRIESLQMDLDRYKKLLEDNERLIKRQDAEKIELMSKLDETRFELKNALGKLKGKEENLAFTLRQLEEANKTLANLQNENLDFEQQFNRIKLELNSLNSTLHKERGVRLDCEKSNENLQCYLRDKNSENKQLCVNVDALRIQNERLNMEKIKLLGEVDLYKNHVLTLSEANDKLSRELDEIVARDDLLYRQLNRKEKISNILNKTKNTVEASLNHLDEFFNKTNRANLSPGFGGRGKNTN